MLSPEYETFKRCLPYPFPQASRALNSPPFYVLNRGPAQFLFLSYYDNALSPGTEQHRWLLDQLKNSEARFTILVMGMGQWPSPKREAVLASLPQGKIDLVIGGDGEGCWLSESTMPSVLFNGCGMGNPSAMTILEVAEHALTLNTFDSQETILFHRVIRDRTVYEQLVDVRARLDRGFIQGLSPDYDEGVFERGDSTATIILASGALPKPPRPARGIQLSVAAVTDKAGAHGLTVKVYLGYRPRGHPDPSFRRRSQPIAIDMNGEQTLIHWAIDRSLNEEMEAVGLQIEEPPSELRTLKIGRFDVF
jgi:hypothetical protein